MSKEWTAGELVELVHNYYPANAYEDGFQSAESQRLLALRDRMEEEWATRWKPFIDHLRTLVPPENVWDLSRPVRVHASYRVRIYIPGSVRGAGSQIAVFGVLSLLAPLYIVFTSYEDYADGKYSYRVFYEPRPETIDLQRMLQIRAGLPLSDAS